MRFRLAEPSLGGNSTIDFYSLLLFHPYASVVVDEETRRHRLDRLHARESRLHFCILICTARLFRRVITSAKILPHRRAARATPEKMFSHASVSIRICRTIIVFRFLPGGSLASLPANPTLNVRGCSVAAPMTRGFILDASSKYALPIPPSVSLA